MAADAKSSMAQDKEPPKEAAKPRKSFKDYASIAVATLMDPRALPSIGRELAYAVTDIRQKVVEEGMYGQTVTPLYQEPERDGQSATKAAPEGEGDPLGRTGSAGESRFKQRCRDAFEKGGSREPDGPSPGPERGPQR